MFRRRSHSLSIAVLIAALGIGQRAEALVVPTKEPLAARVHAPAGYVATPVPVPVESVASDVDPSLLVELADFRRSHGQEWAMFVDRRSGALALAEGVGIRWIPVGGAGSWTDLESRARAFIARYPSFFQVPNDELVLDRKGSRNFGEQGQFWNLAFVQTIDSVPVASSRVVFRVAHGRLVQFGVDRVLPTLRLEHARMAAVPLLSVTRARDVLGAHIGGFEFADRFHGEGTLEWILRGAKDEVGYTGPVGRGWEPELSYRFRFERPGQLGGWQAQVDARRGIVTRFVDSNDYAALVRGSVYPFTNCTNPMNCVPGSELEVGITMPFARLDFVGGLCSGDDCFTNSAGAFDYPPGATAASTSLDGKYFQIVDGCGAIAAAGVAPGEIDLGTSPPNPPFDANYDCAPATQSSPPYPPPATETSGGPGDTHAARNCFYHLNLINQKARAYLPGNDWLAGTDGSAGAVKTLTNLPPACNAFWSGGPGTLNFHKFTPGLFCNNTGELPDVFLHEFGHGLDQNDGTGTAPESATGEAMGDTFALLQGQHSCIGVGFRLHDVTSPIWGNTAGYGSSSRLCSGVRDIDYTRFCTHGATEGCTTPTDLDATNGSRSGPGPFLPEPLAEVGTPARWNNMIPTALPTADGLTNFYNCGGPETTGCAGPLNHGCHCESQIPSQANWDLAKQLIRNEFGGSVYTVPQGPTEVSGWQYMDRLWYLTRDIAVSGYSVTGPSPGGTTNGCAISDWFSTYRFIDDDDGNLANGTPHADILFSAFDLHAIACGSASDPSNQATGCPSPIAAPVLAACDNKSPVQISWSASAGATSYRVLRNTLGCGFGFTPIATTLATSLYYQDADVAPGVAYYYSVQPVGVNASCYGQASNCVVVTPTTCDVTFPTAPDGVALSTPAANQIQVSWNAVSGAGSYKVYRKGGACASSEDYVALGVVLAPTRTFLDTQGLQGGVTYSYQVVATDNSCASCVSGPSACLAIQATGSCTLLPSFGGATRIVAGAVGECKLTIEWAAGSAQCGTSIAYSIYRSTDSGFVPGPANLVIAGLTGTTYVDWAVVGGTRYHYVVRATDTFGNDDGNTIRRNEVPIGTLSPGTFMDDAGDTGSAKFAPSPTINNQWAIRANDLPGNATRVYATTPSGNYSTNSCERLESVTVFLGASPNLSFRSRYDIEPGWDGGYVEVSTEAGGYADWTKLQTVNYPGVMTGPLGDPACGGAGFTDGQSVFTGTATGWGTYSGSLSGYANQAIRLGFRFSSDPSTEQAGWFVDDVQVSGALLPGPCMTEVSGVGSGHPLRVTKSGANLDLVFQNLGAVATSYNVYEGTLGGWYSHTTKTCHFTGTTPDVPAAGDRTWSGYSTAAASAYFLINAIGGGQEGLLGIDSTSTPIPLGASPCGP